MKPLVCGFVHTNELIYKTEINTQTQKTNLWLPKWGGEGSIRSLELADTHYYISNKQHGPTLWHRKLYAKYCNNLSWERIGKTICIRSNHCYILKLAQHCKSALLQLKKEQNCSGYGKFEILVLVLLPQKQILR